MSKTIKSTDLILQKGAVYHLGIRPEDLASKVIAVGDPGRVEKISRYFDRVDFKAEHREFVTHTGTYQGKRITVISTGMGTDNIEILMTELDALVNVDLETRTEKENKQALDIVRIGTSGSLRANIPVDTLLVSAMGIGLDTLMSFYPFPVSKEDQRLSDALREHAGLPFSPYISYADSGLLSRVGEGMVRGITLTCPGFYAPQGRSVRLQPAQGDLLSHYISFQHGQIQITNFEMETAGYYSMGSLLGHRMLSVNVIVANRVNDVFSTQADQAMDQAIRLVLDRI
jgi:uridine phosphorylase